MRHRQIEAFHAIYVSGSISAAARALNVSQPSLTKVLQHAEQQLGFALFRRVRGRLVATEEAHTLFQEVNEIHERLVSLRRTARNLRTGVEGNVRIAVLPALGLDIAPAAIAAFRSLHTGVTVEVMTLHHDEILRCLYERRSELAISYAPAPHPRLRTVELGTTELVLMCPRDTQLPAGARVPLSWLKGRSIIGMSSSGPVGDLFAATLARLQVAATEVISAQTFYLAAALVRHGAGMAIVDEPTARAMRHPQVTYRRFEPAIQFDICATHLEDRPPSRLARELMHVLRDQLHTILSASTP